MVSGGPPGRRAYSNVTLALARDSGWYVPNVAVAGLQRFGALAGCAMLVRCPVAKRCSSSAATL